MIGKSFKVLCLSLVIVLAGCATAAPVPMGNDTYMISQTSAGGMFKAMGSLKTEVMNQANAFAASKGKVAIPIAAHEAPAYPGHMPNFEYQFRLVDKNDPRASGSALIPRADVVVEMQTPNSAPQPDTIKSKDMYTELLKLDDLRKRGVITEAEFEAQKSKLLSGN
jgi:hypothetical protein